MPKKPTSRITVSLPQGIVDDLDYVSSKLRCSRSALLSIALSESMPGLRQICSCLPDPGSDVDEVDARRFRGESARVLGDMFGKLLAGGQDDLFSE